MKKIITVLAGLLITLSSFASTMGIEIWCSFKASKNKECKDIKWDGKADTETTISAEIAMVNGIPCWNVYINEIDNNRKFYYNDFINTVKDGGYDIVDEKAVPVEENNRHWECVSIKKDLIQTLFTYSDKPY